MVSLKAATLLLIASGLWAQTTTPVVRGTGTGAAGAGGGQTVGVLLPGVNYQSAFSFSTVDAGSISAALAQCGSVPCQVLLPPSYVKTPVVPGSSTQNWFDGSPATTAVGPTNAAIVDMRWGDANTTVSNCFGYNLPGNHICEINTFNYIVDPTTLRVFDNLGGIINITNAMDGGVNLPGNGLTATNKTNWFGGGNVLIRSTEGQAEAGGNKIFGYGLGDVLIQSNFGYTWSGPNADSDESNELSDWEIFGDNVEATGTVASDSVNILTASGWTYGQGTVGVGRYAIRENAGTSTGTVSSIVSRPGVGPTVVTVNAAVAASTVVGTLGTNTVPPLGTSGTFTVTPTFSVGSMSLINVGTNVCVADVGGIETVTVTGKTAATFSGVFRKNHAAAAIIATGGGHECDLFSLNNENVTDSHNFLLSGTKIQPIPGTLHNVIPIIYSDATHYYLWYVTNGQYDGWNALWTASANGYTTYQGAEVVSVVKSGLIGNQITLAPKHFTFSAGDTFGVPHYFSMAMLTGHMSMENTLPNPSYNSGGFSYEYNFPMGGSDGLLSLYNNADPALYANQVLIPPAGMSIYGPTKWTLNTQYSPAYWVIGVGCASPGLLCAYPETLFHLGNQDGGADSFTYNPYGSNEYFQWSTGNQTGANYSMFTDHFDISNGSLTMEERTGGTQVGITESGSYVIGLGMTQAPLYWTIGTGCANPCTATVHILASANATLQDYLDYDEANKQYTLSANNNSARYTFGATGFVTPWTTNGAGIDSYSTQNYYSSENFIFGSMAIPLTQPVCDSTVAGLSHVGYLSPFAYGQDYAGLLLCTNRGGNITWVQPGTGDESFNGASGVVTLNPLSPSSTINLTGNVSSWSMAAGAVGQQKTITWCQDTIGGRSVPAPSGGGTIKGFTTPGTTPNTCSSQTFKQMRAPNEWIAITQANLNVPF